MSASGSRRWLAALVALCVVWPAAGADKIGKVEKLDTVDKADNADKKEEKVRFAVIGDYGTNDATEDDMVKMVKGWQPEFIVTVGDNSYVDPEKKKSGFELGVSDHFGDFIQNREKDPKGEKTRFFPSIGNHDYESDGIGGAYDLKRLADYEKEFAVPAGEGGFHYYEFVKGPVHFFALDSNKNRIWDGASTKSKQYAWWKKSMGAATEHWKIVYFHHAPYDSGYRHRNDTQMRAWDFEHSGVTAVLAGHEHIYERIMLNGVPFITNGIGGRHLHGFREPYVPGSTVRYPQPDEKTADDKRFGAMLVEATDTTITFEEWNVDHKLIDRWPTDAKPIDVAPTPPKPAP